MLFVVHKVYSVPTFRQQLEREALKQKHRDEIEAFCHQQLMQQLNPNTSNFQTLQQTAPSSPPIVSTHASTAVNPVIYQSMAPAYTGNSDIVCRHQK
jgi:hypothetical protein